MSRSLIIAALLFAWTGGVAQEPPRNDRDPILDSEQAPENKRLKRPDSAPNGLIVRSSGLIYFGDVHSYLLPEQSRLLSGARPGLGFGLGARVGARLELAVDVSLGLGKTFEIDRPQGKSAFDVLIDPRVHIHVVENDPLSVYAGLGVLFGLFDLEKSGVSQAGLGPSLSVGALLAIDRHFGLFIDLSGSYFYDALAYSYREDETGFGQSMERLSKEEGDWFTIYRMTLGLRLAGF